MLLISSSFLLFVLWLLRIFVLSGCIFSPALSVRGVSCVDPPFCRGTSQGKYGLRIIGLVCEGETVGKIGEADEIGERELVLVVSVKCGKE